MRLVDLALALLHDRLDRNLRAGPDQEQVSDGDLGGRHLDRLPLTDDERRGRREVEQRTIASLAPPRARISNQWPNGTKLASIAAAS